MSLLHNIAGGLRALFRKQCAERELDEELRAYVDAAAEAKVNSGLTREESLRAARLEAGSLESTKEKVRAAGWEYALDTLWQDLRFAVRMLRKSPGFTAVAVLTLALGIGANTAIFSVVDTVLLNALPFTNSTRLVWAWGNFPKSSKAAVSPPDFLDFRAQNHSFEHFSAFSSADPGNLTIGGHAEQAEGAMVSSGFFETFGAGPLLGRTFTPNDEQVALPETIILTYRLWQEQFGADRNVIGRTVNFNGGSMTIIGVMPARFDYPPQVGVWFPIPMLNSGMQLRPFHFLRPIGLLKPGVALTQAQGDVDAIARQLAEQYPSSNKGWNLRLEPMQDAVIGPLRAPLLLLVGAVALVLLIACVNVANLLLARNSARQREIAVRTALGASRGRIVVQLVTESVILALLGGGIGIVLARSGMTLLHSFGPANVPRLAVVQMNKDVLAFTAALSISAGILFGLVPAFQASKTNVQDFLREVGRFSTHAGHQRLRNVLVICEVMLSVALLVGAGLLLDSLWRLLHENPGFDSERIVTAQLVLPSKRYSEEYRRAAFFRDFLEKIRALPGVEAAGSTSGLPLSGQLNDDYFTTDATPPARLQDADLADMRLVIGDYFLAMRIPLLEGRLFPEPDEPDSRRDVVVDVPFVRRYFPNVDPIGSHLLIFEPGGFVSREIVGVVGGARFFSLQSPPQPTMYLPYAQLSGFNMNVVVRSAADPEQLASGIRAALASVDPDESLSSFRAMREVVSASVADKRFDTFLLALFSAVALALAAAGIYGLVSYVVVQKTREIGIRLAIGAAPSNVLKLTLAQGMKLVAIGMICGLALALGLTRLIASQLYGVKATDPSTFAAAVLILGLVALLACYVPARRATKVDPIVALRHE